MLTSKMKMLKLALALSALGVACAVPATGDVARRVVDAIVAQNETFFPCDKYGAALMQQALWEGNAAFPDAMDTRLLLSTRLDACAATPGTSAYDILHRANFTWDHAIGDLKGLFPNAYLERAAYYETHCSTPYSYDNASDVRVATGAARRYILSWPVLLPDGAVARLTGGELGPPCKSSSQCQSNVCRNGNCASLTPRYVWGDDTFMGLTGLARLATAMAGDAEWEQHGLAWAGGQLLRLSGYLRDPADGLYLHGYDAAARQLACCKWGRANGWSMMAGAELLAAYDAVAARHGGAGVNATQRAAVLALFRAHAAAMRAVQHPTDGRWHQLLNVSSSFLETSATAMTLYAMATGLRAGWLDVPTYNATVYAAWAGLASTVAPDGTVSGICSGCGIKATPEEYTNHTTTWIKSLNGGLGAVLRAATAMRLLETYGPGEYVDKL